ncbi:MAG: adenosylcobalamin-dependent ribonucleoside-diphosphate reductase [Clostridia bacterium]|nr:adenosylcobalamin-dependent ribonucleoside-diphosphate reductase [Clostridia bacterium]
MELNPVALKILEERYLQPGETPEGRFRAIARHLASIEGDHKGEWEEKYFAAFDQGLLILNSPVLANYGVAGRKPQGSACFVVKVEDDLEDIGNTKTKAMLIQKSGGGTGLNFSTLRPRGALIGSTGRPSSGVVPFLLSFHADCQAVSQGGFRRGAFMAVLDCRHPDLEEFIDIKRDPRELTNFNLSVGITDRFMEAVLADRDWELRWHNYKGEKEISRVTRARDIFLRIVRAAHNNGEPGLLFLDRLQETNPIPSRIINCTNPCGEQPLSPWESCVLGHVNLAAHLKRISCGSNQVAEPGAKTLPSSSQLARLVSMEAGVGPSWPQCLITPRRNYSIDCQKLADTVTLLVRMLDNVVTLNEYPLPVLRETHSRSRKIGLGFTGLADVLIRLGLPYSSEEGLNLSGEIMRFINQEALRASVNLGLERGSFPLFLQSIYHGKVPALRNAARTTVAPTGTTSAILDVEGYGCEPLAAIAYTRTMLNGQKVPFVSGLFREIAREEGWYSGELMDRVTAQGTARVPGVPAKWQKVFVTAGEIHYLDHIRMQAALQRHNDSGISKTVNLPADATVDDVYQAYLTAYRTKLIKGITVFRAGSRQGAPIELGAGVKCDC